MKRLSNRLAEYAAALSFADLPPGVVHETKRRLMDSLACALGAYNSPPARAAREIALEIKSTTGAAILGTAQKSSPDLSAFANGILVRYLDYNDTYLSMEPAHPSDNIAPALAVAEAAGADGKGLIAAIALGYEVQCRLCDAASLREKGWDHVAYVSISSALLCSRLMGLGPEKSAHAVSLSITPGIPLRQTRVGELSMWKGCAGAFAARGGVFAAILAGRGITGPSEVFEGERGFFNQVTGPFDLDMDAFGGRSGDFKMEETYLKYYPTEYHSQAGIEASLELAKEVRVAEIEEVNIETYDACVDIIAGDRSKWEPRTRETADHSLPYCVAVALMDGTVGLEQFSEKRILDPKVRTLMDRIKVKRNPEYTSLYPEAFPCRVEIRTRGGGRFERTVSYPKGHPKNPLTDREVEGKLEALSRGLVEGAALREAIKRIWRLEELRDISGLMGLFTVKGGF
ncbi:MAG: MmgE/PrpD family protein [Thermodesulfobacteriota bacterium]|nr:MAG: MmgE/PrpD family protein [Thermodesulfobacteriota bacterium]